MTPMYRPGTAAVIDDAVAAEADFMRVTAISAVQVAVVANPARPVGIVRGRALPCAGDPDLFFAESPDDVELAKSLCGDCPVRAQCLAGAIERREPWGVWGGELFLRGEIVPRKRARGRPRKSDVAA
jgi:WhiB family transcriptional regulator, redox-sensing transcriptional regulator